MKKILVYVLFAMFFVSNIYAEDKEYSLGEIVITESKIEQSEQYITQKVDTKLK